MLRLKSKCKICRRYGERMFVKGERDLGPKCAHIRRGTRPGMHGKARRRNVSEFAAALGEKQKVRFTYGISNKALEHAFRKASKMAGKTTDTLVQLLEQRLDNAVFRAGFTVSRSIARHIVSHGHITVNGRRVTISSYRIRPGDVIQIREASKNSPLFADLANRLKKYDAPSWIELDREAIKATIKAVPQAEEFGLNRDLRLVVGFYSK